MDFDQLDVQIVIYFNTFDGGDWPVFAASTSGLDAQDMVVVNGVQYNVYHNTASYFGCFLIR